MKRSALRTRNTNSRLTISPIRCKAPGCRVKFLAVPSTQIVCSVSCSEAYVAAVRAKAERKAEKQASALHRAKLADSKPLSHWLALTERVVNKFVLARDFGKPCFTCGATKSALFQAGHFLSVGARPELRFDAARNIRKQCHHCNVYKSGNQALYETNLRIELGNDAVDKLKGPHPTAKYTREYLEGLRKTFAAETRRIKA